MKEGFGGITCESNCKNYEWHEAALKMIEDRGIDTYKIFKGTYVGHHPACSYYLEPELNKSERTTGAGTVKAWASKWA